MSKNVQIWHEDSIIADVINDQHNQCEANARFIVKAVNHHDQEVLLAAFESIGFEVVEHS